jgi:hypothetical protein
MRTNTNFGAPHAKKRMEVRRRIEFFHFQGTT